MRLGSLECRWFFPGPPPDEVVRWFRETRPWSDGRTNPSLPWPGSWRVDRYLPLPGRDDMGLKWRRESPGGAPPLLEIKGRTEELGVRPLGSKPEDGGRLERWTKWSYPGEEISTGFRRLFEGAPAVPVRKKRLLRKVRMTPGSPPLEVPASEVPERGLGVELTRVELPGGLHWTLGLEAFPTTLEPAILLSEAERLLREAPAALVLDPAGSASYPAWLLRDATRTPGRGPT